MKLIKILSFGLLIGVLGNYGNRVLIASEIEPPSKMMEKK